RSAPPSGRRVAASASVIALRRRYRPLASPAAAPPLRPSGAPVLPVPPRTAAAFLAHAGAADAASALPSSAHAAGSPLVFVDGATRPAGGGFPRAPAALP